MVLAFVDVWIFWGENMLYYGLYHNHIYTDGYSTLKSLIQEYPELKNAIQ